MTNGRVPAQDRRTAYLHAAVELLDEVGPATQSLGLTVAQLGRATTLRRSMVYRHWDTIEELNCDVVALAATSNAAWQSRLVRVPVELPLQRALCLSLDGPLVDLSTVAQALVSGWPGSHPVRIEVQAGERRSLDDLEHWLDAHLAAHGRRRHRAMEAATLSVAVSAIIVGYQLAWLFAADLGSRRWTSQDCAPLAERLGRVLERATTSGARGEVRPELAPEPTVSPRRALLQEVLAGLGSDDALDLWLPPPVRLVKLAPLGRRLGVHERRLYAMWPTASAMNAEVVAAVAHRENSLADELLSRAIAEGAQGRHQGIEELFIDCFDEVVCLPLERFGSNMFTCSQSLSDPVVHRSFAVPFTRWFEETRMAFLAGQALAGRVRRPDLCVDECSASLREAAFGMRRLVAVHPELRARRVGGGARYPLAGLVPMLAADATLERDV